MRSPEETREIELVEAREMVAVSSSPVVVPPLANCFDMVGSVFCCFVVVCLCGGVVECNGVRASLIICRRYNDCSLYLLQALLLC